jgi:DNA-binding NtrC family response regulator
MRVLSGSLNLVSFASPLQCDGLKDVLLSLGYSIHPSRGDEWPAKASLRPYFPIVFVLGCPSACPIETVRSFLVSHVEVPLVGVFPRDAPIEDSSILGRCTDFLAWPCHREELALRLKRAGVGLPERQDAAEVERLFGEFARMDLVGSSSVFLGILRVIDKLARSDAAVLIRGETGTGKELAARAIHYRSSRRYHPFIPVNCGAIPDNLLENELFGHERGAFTDAKASQKGLVAEADGGTLFLDEVDALSVKAQVALLRFLQDQEYRPLGASSLRKANARIIAASNSDLRARVQRREFREDLFFRLRILPLALPPLRERPEDVEVLAHHFLGRYARRYGKHRKAIHPLALDWMMSHPWPGNVRELENVIHRAFLVSEGPLMDLASVMESAEALPGSEIREPGRFDGGFHRAKAATVERFEKQYLSWLMSETRGNVTQAAKRAGKERRALGRLLKKHRIPKDPRAYE